MFVLWQRLYDAPCSVTRYILNALDLFSGIGGFSLGLERTNGFRTIAFCEVDKYCQKVLRKHWPDIPIHDDVRRLNAAGLVERIDVVCGGFPCQDISTAGKGAGLDGARSGLWFEMFRIITETRPRYVIVENVAVLRSRGLDVVLGCLASIGYDAEWHCIPAAAVGAPHRRDRVWIVAYPHTECSEGSQRHRADVFGRRTNEAEQTRLVGSAEYVADADQRRLHVDRNNSSRDSRNSGPETGCGDDGTTWCGGTYVADADSDDGRQRRAWRSDPGCEGQHIAERAFRDADSAGLAQRQGEPGDARPKLTTVIRADWWIVEPDVGRVANGIPARVDRLRALGNSIVPQIAEQIGAAILYHEALQ